MNNVSFAGSSVTERLSFLVFSCVWIKFFLANVWHKSRPLHHLREAFIKLINQALCHFNANNIIHKATVVMLLCRHLL